MGFWADLTGTSFPVYQIKDPITGVVTQGTETGFQEFDDKQSIVQSTVASVTSNLSKGLERIKETFISDPNPQEDGGWFASFQEKFSLGSWFSGTLTKIIVLVVVVAIAALFIMSFVQAKAGRLANA